jgi:hypothetical protein
VIVICWREISLRESRKYIIAVGLLAVLALVFGLIGTVAPESKSTLPQQESSSSPSSSTAHFTYPPTYDSGWLDITGEAGEYITIVHNLNNTDVVVDITGKTTADGGAHQKYFGGTDFVAGWNKTYGGTGIDGASSFVHTVDGGYALAGDASFGAGAYDFWLVKTDAGGNMQWNQTYGGTDDDNGLSVVQTSDGGYALAGYTFSFGAGYIDVWLVKTDTYGNMQWNRTYGGTGGDTANSAIQTSDGGYAIAGYTDSYGAGNCDFYLVKTDPSGNMQWNKTYGGTGNDVLYSMIQTNDGGYFLIGVTNSFGAGGNDLWVVKTDSAGNAEWNKTYGGTGDDQGFRAVQTSDGGYAIGGWTDSFGAGGGDFYLVKTDAGGNMQWNKTYGGTNYDGCGGLIQTSDGGYALVGATWSFGAGGRDGWLVKTDSAGTMLWNKTYGGTGGIYGEELHGVIQTSDGGYATAGWTDSFGAGSIDAWLIKTDAAGNVLDGFKYGLAWISSTVNATKLYRGTDDVNWNYVRVRIWLIKEPTWIYGDINMDGIVDAKDLYILSQNYGKTFSLLSLTGIVAIASIHQIKKRKKQPN